MSVPLTAAQVAALAHLRHRALGDSAAGGRLVGHDIGRLLDGVRRHGRVTINFHPDRRAVTGLTVAEGLLADGVYRTQHETGISSGGLGEIRFTLERGLFGEVFDAPGVLVTERPVYGALDLIGDPDGASPRFGSCHLVLHAAVLERTTFTHGDSYTAPTDVGTIDAFEPVLAGVLDAAPSLAALLLAPSRPAAEPGRRLDGYIEAQVHGPVRLATDVTAVVADPSFLGTSTGRALLGLAERYGIQVRWHNGFALPVAAVPADFRGPQMPPLAAQVDRLFGAGRGWLDPALLGLAAAAIRDDPAGWADWGTPTEALQLIKYLWHVLVRFSAGPSGTTGPHAAPPTGPRAAPPP